MQAHIIHYREKVNGIYYSLKNYKENLKRDDILYTRQKHSRLKTDSRHSELDSEPHRIAGQARNDEGLFSTIITDIFPAKYKSVLYINKFLN